MPQPERRVRNVLAEPPIGPRSSTLPMLHSPRDVNSRNHKETDGMVENSNQFRRSAYTQDRGNVTLEAPQTILRPNFVSGNTQTSHIRTGNGRANGQTAISSGVDEWFSNLESKTFALLNRRASSRHEKVRIAILDTGIDGRFCGTTGYSKHIKGYMSLVEPCVVPFKTSNGMSRSQLEKLHDTNGHGTHCAAMILRVAKYAEIFICRVAAGTNPAPDALVKAIDYAAAKNKWNVDIISMSLGYEKVEDKVDEAIARAIHMNHVLFFAATGNEPDDMGRPIAFPASKSSVFGIHSANFAGLQSRGNPLRHKLGKIYTILGEDVPGTWPGVASRIRSGSSTATPIAAATAALILEFARQKSSTTGKQSPLMERLAPRMKEEWFMERIFDDMAKNIDGAKFIRPWQWLNANDDVAVGAHDAADDKNPHSARNQYEMWLYHLFKVDHSL